MSDNTTHYADPATLSRLIELEKDKKRLDWLANTEVWFEEPSDGHWTPESWRREIDRIMKIEEESKNNESNT